MFFSHQLQTDLHPSSCTPRSRFGPLGERKDPCRKSVASKNEMMAKRQTYDKVSSALLWQKSRKTLYDGSLFVKAGYNSCTHFVEQACRKLGVDLASGCRSEGVGNSQESEKGGNNFHCFKYVVFQFKAEGKYYEASVSCVRSIVQGCYRSFECELIKSCDDNCVQRHTLWKRYPLRTWKRNPNSWNVLFFTYY